MSEDRQMPTDEEMHRLFHEEARRTVHALGSPIVATLDQHEIGKGMPPRIAACVVLHSLTLIGVNIARQYQLPKEAVLDVLKMVGSTFED